MASRRIGMFGVEPSEFIDDRNEDGVAALLRRRREELGRDVPTVARQLRIRPIYIQAIEDGRLQDLPGTAYAVGFVRAYADYLGLDGNSIVSDYRDELARRSRQNQLIWPVDQVEHKHFPGGIILVVSLVVAVLLYGGWYFASQPGGTGIDLIDQVPEFMKKQTEEPAAETAPDVVEGAASGTEVVPPAATSTTTESNSGSTAGAAPSSAQAASNAATPNVAAPSGTEPSVTVPSPETPETTIPEATTVNPAVPSAPSTDVLPTTTDTAPVVTAVPGQTTDPLAPAAPATDPATGQATTPESTIPDAAAASDVDPALPGGETVPATADEAVQEAAVPAPRIMLRAAKDSWVEIFDAEQNVVLQRILRAGETYAVPDQPGLVMNTGNAGGLVIELDGRATPSLGSIGVVKRGIALNPAALSVQ
jgi:cytoskeleton protein RodZ